MDTSLETVVSMEKGNWTEETALEPLQKIFEKDAILSRIALTGHLQPFISRDW